MRLFSRSWSTPPRLSYDLDSPVSISSATVDVLEKGTLSYSLVMKLRTLQDRQFKSDKLLGQALRDSMSATDLEAVSAIGGHEMIPLYRNVSGRRMIGHSGDTGERLAAVPGYGIAVARTINNKPNGEFDDMGTLVFQLLPSVPPQPQAGVAPHY